MQTKATQRGWETARILAVWTGHGKPGETGLHPTRPPAGSAKSGLGLKSTGPYTGPDLQTGLGPEALTGHPGGLAGLAGRALGTQSDVSAG